MRRTVQLPFQDRSWGHDALICVLLWHDYACGDTSPTAHELPAWAGPPHISGVRPDRKRARGTPRMARLDHEVMDLASQLITPNDLGDVDLVELIH